MSIISCGACLLKKASATPSALYKIPPTEATTPVPSAVGSTAPSVKNERDQNMSCFEGLEMGFNLEVLRPEVDALGRWSRSYRYQKPVRFCALVAQRGVRDC